VFAVTKTSDTSGSDPLILLNVRATTGAWSTHVVGRYSDGYTRPIVQLDEQNGRVHVIMTCGSTGGSICQKTSPLGAIAFGMGAATTIIRDESAPELNDVTSTKQNLSGATGLVVMASQEAARTYWHTDLPLGGPPPPVSADFTASPDGGTAPVTVAFRDASSGSPTSWRWDFGDGTSSTSRNPSHTYTAAGSYTVILRVANSSGSDTRTKTGAVVVAAPGGTDPGGSGTGGAGVGGTGAGGSDVGGSDVGGSDVGGSDVGGSGAGGSGSGGSGSGGSGSVTRRSSGGVLGETALGRRISVGLRATRLRGGRVRLSGSVSVRLARVKVSLQRRSSTGRWTTLRRTTLLPLAGGKSRYAFTLGRPMRSTSYRVVVPSAAGRTRAVSRALRVTAARR
jgi:PKD repeat protein